MDDESLFYGFGSAHDLVNDERLLPCYYLRSVSRAACIAFGKSRDAKRRNPIGFNTRP